MSSDDVNAGGWIQMESKDDALQDTTVESPSTGFSILQWETSQYMCAPIHRPHLRLRLVLT